MDELKRCSKCKEWKNPEAFNKMARSRDGLRPSCRRCDHKMNGIGDTTETADLFVPLSVKKEKARQAALKKHGVSGLHELNKGRDVYERFISFAEKTDSGCWVWKGARNNLGYGFFSIARGKHEAAHRWSYKFKHGPIPVGLVIDHLCRNPSCVNPDHLEPVTNKENTLRGIAPNVLLHHLNECKQGHVLEGENIYWRNNGTRECRTCRIERTRRSDEKRRIAS